MPAALSTTQVAAFSQVQQHLRRLATVRQVIRPTINQQRRAVAASAAATGVAETAITTTMSPSADVKARAKAAVLGAFVADAATMPLHWIYDVPKINDLLAAKGREATPEFYDTPSCPFYKAEFGYQSPYADEMIPLLQSLAEKGELDGDAYSEAAYKFFTTGTSYRNKSIRTLIEKYEAGSRGTACGDPDDFQANCFAKVPLLVARYAGQPELLAQVEAAIRVQQNNDNAVKFGTDAAKLLEKVVLGASLDEALTWAASEGSSLQLKDMVQKALASRTTPLTELTYEPASYMKDMVQKHVDIKDTLPPFSWAVWCNGPACGNPAAFANVLMAAVLHPTFEEAVRANLLAGGDNCSRACFIGALLAAEGGLDSIPEEWRKQTVRYAELEQLTDTVVASA